MFLKDNYKIILILLIFLSTISFFLGFYFDENSAGAGLYTGDFGLIWKNLQIFLNNNITDSLIHSDYVDSRAPTAYIFHELFNPFVKTKIGFRRSVFFISLLLPIFFYLCLKQKFKKNENLLLILISSIVFLSPYFRTSAFWGLQENYGLIFLLLTYLFYDKFLQNNDVKGFKIYFQLFLINFFSSCALYFDTKLIIIPIICYFKIIFSGKGIKLKLFSTLIYFIFSLPYIYLIIIWGSFLPPEIDVARKVGDKLFLGHIGYSSTIVALYILPILFFNEKKLYNLIIDFFQNKKNYYLISIFFLYLFYLIFFYEFSEQSFLGKGYIHKVSLILFDNVALQKIFTYSAFFISWLIILLYIGKNYYDRAILTYFLIYPIMLWPILQEYFDPLVLLMIFTFFSSKLVLNYKSSILLYLYLSTFLIFSNIYYMNLLS